MPALQIKRKIHFFYVTSNNCIFENILRELNGLQGNQANFEIEEDKVFFIRRYRKLTNHSFCIFSSLKMSDLPNRCALNTREPIPLDLGDDEGLEDATHFCYFSGSKILAVEYNHFGPRAMALQTYINQKLMDLRGPDTNESVLISPILSRNFMKMLNKIGEIKVLTMQVPINRAGDLEEIADGSLKQTILQAADFGETEEVLVSFKKAPRSTKPIFRNAGQLLADLKRLFTRIPPSDTFDQFKIKAVNTETGGIEEFDLLKDKTEEEIKTVKLGKTRSIDSEDIFEKITDAYELRKRELLSLLPAR